MAIPKRSQRGQWSQRAAGLATILAPSILASILLVAAPARAAVGNRRVVTYSSPDGFRIFASYYSPSAPSHRAIVIFPDPKEGRRSWESIADTLSLRGFHVLVPDLRGTGESTIQRGIRRDRPYFSDAELAATTADANPAIRFVREIPGVGIRTILVIGSGEGGAPALRAVAQGSDRVIRVLISPVPLDGGKNGPPREPGPLLIIVAKDDVVGIEGTAGWVTGDRSPECWLVDGSGQGSALMQARADLVRNLVAWIDRSGAGADSSSGSP